MDDKELVYVWRKEFEEKVKKTKEYIHAMDFIKPHIFDVDSAGKYKKPDTETLWQGFLMAKRSQPSVVLPEPEDIYDSGYIWQGRYYHEGVVTNSITEAGIKYTIGE